MGKRSRALLFRFLACGRARVLPRVVLEAERAAELCLENEKYVTGDGGADGAEEAERL